MTDRETDVMFAASRGRAEKKPPKTHRNRREKTEDKEQSKVLVPEWTDDRVSDKKKRFISQTVGCLFSLQTRRTISEDHFKKDESSGSAFLFIISVKTLI